MNDERPNPSPWKRNPSGSDGAVPESGTWSSVGSAVSVVLIVVGLFAWWVYRSDVKAKRPDPVKAMPAFKYAPPQLGPTPEQRAANEAVAKQDSETVRNSLSSCAATFSVQMLIFTRAMGYPEIILYGIAGCAQDVIALREHVEALKLRTPVRVDVDYGR